MPQPASRPLGAVVVGTGFGARVHVPALRAAGFCVHALVGRDRERTARRAARLDVPRAFGSIEDALALPEVDAVTIATPPASHAENALAAIRAGKHVLCEKPMALDTAEARRMLEAAQSAKIVHLVGHEFRFAPERALVARVIADGGIGEPRMASFTSFVTLAADPAVSLPEWWLDAARGGGWLGASGSHAVDQVRAWLGEFAAVSATLPTVADRAHGAEDSFAVLFRLRSGVDGVLQQSSGAWGPMASTTCVAGTRGTVWLEGPEVWVADRSGARRVEIPPDLCLPPAPPGSDDPRHRFTHLEIGPYTRLAEAFAAAIRGEAATRDQPRAATFADGLATQAVLDAIRDSAARRCRVEIS